MKFIAIIPARYASTRFPGKPLADIQGKPMIQHVYERTSQVFEHAASPRTIHASPRPWTGSAAAPS